MGSSRRDCGKRIHPGRLDTDPVGTDFDHALAWNPVFNLLGRREDGRMTLEQFLTELPPDQKIRIGTKPGGGFIYIGKAGKTLDRGLANSMRRKMLKRMYLQMEEENPNYKRKYLHNMIDRCINCEGIIRRDVMETYPALLDDSIVIIIPGTERLEEYEDKTTASPRNVNVHAVQSLAAAIYREVCCELIDGYRKNNKTRQQELEDWIMEDPYGILDMPDGIINACRCRAKMRGKFKRVMI